MNYPDIDPIAISIGSLSIHWYGISYALGLLFFLWYGRLRVGQPNSILTVDLLSVLNVYAVLGIILGGRIGYMVFYAREQLFADSTSLFYIWNGGMSFHGGFLGVFTAAALFAYRKKLHFMQLTDSIVPLVPVGLGLGRLGNFINTELPGRITDVFWGFNYPCAVVLQLTPNACTDVYGYEGLLRHPSSLYQAFAEGAILFLIIYVFNQKKRPIGFISGVFLLGYGLLRCLTEFFRSPDAGIGFLWNAGITTGQLLSIPMILFGCFFMMRHLLKPSV